MTCPTPPSTAAHRSNPPASPSVGDLLPVPAHLHTGHWQHAPCKTGGSARQATAGADLPKGAQCPAGFAKAFHLCMRTMGKNIPFSVQNPSSGGGHTTSEQRCGRAVHWLCQGAKGVAGNCRGGEGWVHPPPYLVHAIRGNGCARTLRLGTQFGS